MTFRSVWVAFEDEFHGDDGEAPSGLITISDCGLTSSAVTARVTEVRSAIDLTTEQAQWLYFALGRILLARGGMDPDGIHGVTDEEAHAMRPGRQETLAPTLSDVIGASKIGGTQP